jgi:hypothetical protein
METGAKETLLPFSGFGSLNVGLGIFVICIVKMNKNLLDYRRILIFIINNKYILKQYLSLASNL